MTANAASFLPDVGSVGVATVVTAEDPRAPVVRSERFGTLRARLAVAGDYRPLAGDLVLVASDEHFNRYVVGVLRALRDAPDESAAPRLVHRPEEGCSVLHVPEGDLRIEAASGRIELHGAGGVDVRSDRDVDVWAEGRVGLCSAGSGGQPGSALHLDGDGAELRAGLLTAKAAHLHVLAERATLLARRADTHLEHLRQRVDLLETRADRILEHAKDSYRTVEGLAQTHAGRLKLVAQTSLHTLAERVKLRAKQAFAIDGDKIYLG